MTTLTCDRCGRVLKDGTNATDARFRLVYGKGAPHDDPATSHDLCWPCLRLILNLIQNKGEPK